MSKQRGKVTISEPVRITTSRPGKSGNRGFHPRLPFFAGNKTKTIPLGVHFSGPGSITDESEIEQAAPKSKSRSLQNSPEKDTASRTELDDDVGHTSGGSYDWLRKQKNSGNLSRTSSMQVLPTAGLKRDTPKKGKFPDLKTSVSWAHFEAVSQMEAPQLEMEVPEQYACDLSALFLGQKFASGKHSRLYQGVYNDEDVAVKFLRLDLCEDSTIATRLERQFMQEVHCLSQLHHPNIVQFVAASWKPPVCCLIMEYVPGGSLRAFLRKCDSGSIPLKTTLSMALDIALGMEYLHSQGVVHRDLKSENLVLTDDFHLKLTDFGIGCLETECELRSADTGTYRWMAPEMITDKRYSKKVDVYSFGIVLWELVTGKLPFENMTPVQVAYAVVNKNLRPPLPDDCPSALRNLMEQCWNSSPERRPNFYQIVQTLEDLEREEPFPLQYAKSILFG